MKAERPRGVAHVVLLVLAGVTLLAGVLALYARSEIIDKDAFADNAVEALEDDAVRAVIGEQIVVNLIDRGSTDLLAARPLLETVVDVVLDLQPFRELFRGAAVQANKILFVRERENVAFDISDASEVVKFALGQFAPQLADDVPRDLDLALVSLKERDFARESLVVADRVRLLGLLLPGVAIVLFAISILIAPDRRTGVLRSAVAFATVGGLLAAVMLIFRDRTINGTYGTDETTDEEIRAAVGGLLDAFFGELFLWVLVLLGVGAVVAAAAAMLDPEDVEGPLARMRRRLLTRPEGRGSRAWRGVLLCVLGILVALDPESALEVVALIVAALLLFAGAGELLQLLERRDRTAAEGTRARRRALLTASATGGTIVVVTTIAALVVFQSAEDPDAVAGGGPEGACNGSRELCDLRIDQAVFGGTHNSFSAADSPGWFIANQRRTISRQLTDGVRLFLLDPHWGVGSTGHVSTDFEAEGRDRNRVAKALPPETLAAAERLVGGLGLGKGSAAAERDIWLCHTVCELGATRMTDALADLRSFLDRNRGEVVVTFIEPYVPPADLEDAFERAGLLDDLATLDPAEPLPTLGDLVAADTRLLVLTERDADPAYPWYHDGFELVQDTPLGAKTVGETSCDENRGTPASPLLMLNNWADVFPPRVRANPPFLEKEFILERVRECERERGQPVNLIAVDFYDLGGMLEAVDELNAERVAEFQRAVEKAGGTTGVEGEQ